MVVLGQEDDEKREEKGTLMQNSQVRQRDRMKRVKEEHLFDLNRRLRVCCKNSTCCFVVHFV